MDGGKQVIGSMEGLECPKRVENVINRKIGTFYIETISQIFLNSDKKYFFELDPKNKKKLTKVENDQNPVENH